MTQYFAEIDQGNVVIRVIVAEQSFIDSGAVGNPSNWIETFEDGSSRHTFAGVGGTYDWQNDVFIYEQPFPSWSLDDNFNWQPPVPKPEEVDKVYTWNEETQSWDVSIDSSGYNSQPS